MSTRPPRLPALTVRGRAFLAAGATIVLCAVVLAQGALVRVGVLLVALVALAWLMVALRRHDVTADRQVAVPIVPAGAPCRVELTVTTATRRLPGTLLLEERLPYALGSRPRFVVDGHDRKRPRDHTLHYSVRSEVRGRFPLGPLTVRATDPFGLAELWRQTRGTAVITVTPRVIPLPPIALDDGRTGSGEHLVQAAAAGSAEDVTVREYRRGDDLRRVHWRSSAKVGELMVRREESPRSARATVLLDNRAWAHAGHGATGSLETAVSAAASVAVHLAGKGYDVRLATADGLASTGWEPVTVILERLAVVTATRSVQIDAGWAGGADRGGTVIAVLGQIGPEDAPALRRIRHDAGTAAALTLDATGWLRPREHAGQPAPSVVAGVRDLGWRVAALTRTRPLELAWRELAARSQVRDRTQVLS